MSTIYRVIAHRADGLSPNRPVDQGISTDREYVLRLAARSAARLSAASNDADDFFAAVVEAAGSSESRGAPETLAYDHGTVTILVLDEERQEQLRHLAEGEHFLLADEDVEALDLGADFDDHELQNVNEVMRAAEERLSQVAALLPDAPCDVEKPGKPAPVYIVHELTGSAYWLDEGVLMACPLDRSGELRLRESVEVEHTDPEHEPATYFIRKALAALGRKTPDANPDCFEVFAEDRVDWIGAAISTESATYIPIVFADGQVGYAVNSSTGDRQEYLYFNPSSDDDGGEPNVFVYQGPVGSPDQDGAVHHYLVLEEGAEDSRPPALPPAAVRQAALRTIGEGRVPEATLIELVATFGDEDARTSPGEAGSSR
jgi:hypothetical protein